MAPTVLFNELNRTDLRRRAPETLLVLPTAATEQHGPHLPVGTDYFTVDWIARAAAEKASAQVPVLVAPTMAYGSSHHHLSWGATFSLSTDAYFKGIYDLVRSIVVEGGFRRVFLLNGHGGNDLLNQIVARDIALQFPAHVAAGSYWSIAWAPLVASGAGGRGHIPGHAGDFETALILAIRPDLVLPQRARHEHAWHQDSRSFYEDYRVERHGWFESIGGHTDSPERATAEDGRRYLGIIVEAVAAVLVQFYQHPFYRAAEGSPGTRD